MGARIYLRPPHTTSATKPVAKPAVASGSRATAPNDPGTGGMANLLHAGLGQR